MEFDENSLEIFEHVIRNVFGLKAIFEQRLVEEFYKEDTVKRDTWTENRKRVKARYFYI